MTLSKIIPIALLHLFSLAATTALAAPLPLENPGFEEELKGWTLSEPTVPMSTIAPKSARSGKLGLHITDKDMETGSSLESNVLPVIPGRVYRVTFQGRCYSPSYGCGVFLRFRDTEGKLLPDPSAVTLRPDATDWGLYQFEVVAPADVTGATLWIHSFSKDRGNWDIDDLQIDELDASVTTAAPSIQPLPILPPLPDPLIPVVLKVDDLGGRGNVPPNWKRITDFALERKIKLSIGIIANSLESTNPAYLAYLKELQDSGLVEFWFHGYDHADHSEEGKTYSEFSNRPYEEQKRRFEISQKLATEKLGAPFATYGPPGGGNTPGSEADWDATIRVIAEDPAMKIWLYPRALDPAGAKLQEAGKVLILDRVGAVNIEQPLFVPSSEKFISGYLKNTKDRKYYILQGHPNQWDAARWAEFVKLVDYLQANKIPIVFPSELAQSLKKP